MLIIEFMFDLSFVVGLFELEYVEIYNNIVGKFFDLIGWKIGDVFVYGMVFVGWIVLGEYKILCVIFF